MMKSLSYPLLGLLILAGLTLPTQGRQFTSNDGRTLEADVVSVTKESAIIKRGARQFTLPLTSLSKADQEYLAAWREEALKNKIPKIEVAINTGKSNRADRNDGYDDRLGSFKFSIAIENEEMHYSLENGKAVLVVVGESCEGKDRYCVMQKTDFKVALEDGGTFEWQGDEVAYKFDDREPSTWGYQYYGYLFQLQNSAGKVIFQKVLPSKLEHGVDKILALKNRAAFDKSFKSTGTASIYSQ